MKPTAVDDGITVVVEELDSSRANEIVSSISKPCSMDSCSCAGASARQLRQEKSSNRLKIPNQSSPHKTSARYFVEKVFVRSTLLIDFPDPRGPPQT